jgi:hypothetical protein
MKYAITWRERPQGSPEAYEATQRRILQVFGAWTAPGAYDPSVGRQSRLLERPHDRRNR